MSRRIVTDQQRQYLFSPDDEPAPGSRTWAILRVWLVDELTGQTPRGAVTLRSSLSGVIPRIAEDGLVGLVGVPQQVFPDLRNQGYEVPVVVEADGYLAHEKVISIAAEPAFPAVFTTALESLSLHRKPVTISGRVVHKNSVGTVPTKGATVEVVEISRQIKPSPVLIPYQATNLVSLTPPLFYARPMATGTIEGRNYSDDKRLIAETRPGDGQIVVHDGKNLNAGDELLIDALQPDLREQRTISAISGGTNQGEPATLTLDAPVAHPHAKYSLVLKINPGLPWQSKPFDDDALPGDVCVFLADLTGIGAPGYAEVSGGLSPGGTPLPDETHGVERFSVVSDGAGYYRLPPLNRVAQLRLHAEANVNGTLFEADVEFRPDYTQQRNQLDLILAQS